jgi:hypothetical protein
MKMSAATRGAPDPVRGQEAETGHPEPDQNESYPPTLVFDQLSREQRHQERTEPGPGQGDARRNPAITIEPGLHRRNRGRVANRQPETKARTERDIGFPNCPDRARGNERSAAEQRAGAGYPVRADPIR